MWDDSQSLIMGAYGGVSLVFGGGGGRLTTAEGYSLGQVVSGEINELTQCKGGVLLFIQGGN